MDDTIKISVRLWTLKVEMPDYLAYLRLSNELFNLRIRKSKLKYKVHELRIDTAQDTMKSKFNADTETVNQLFARFVKVFKRSGEYPASEIKGLSYVGGNCVYINADIDSKEGKCDIVSLNLDKIDFIDEHVHMKSGKVVENLPAEVVNELKRLFYEGSTNSSDWKEF